MGGGRRVVRDWLLVLVTHMIHQSYILQSSNIGFDNFTVIITSTVPAKKQQSNEAETTAITWPKLAI